MRGKRLRRIECGAFSAGFSSLPWLQSVLSSNGMCDRYTNRDTMGGLKGRDESERRVSVEGQGLLGSSLGLPQNSTASPALLQEATTL